MKLGYKIAVRFLKSNIGQTLLIILGIAIGISVQIFIGSLIQGLQKSLVEKTIGDSSQITVSSDIEDKEISDYEALMDKITHTDKVITAVSPASDHPAFLDANGNSGSILLRGFDLEKADSIYNIKNSIVEGGIPQKKNEILLGIDLKEEYGLSIGDEINLITPEKKTITCTVAGFFDLKVAAINKNWAITTLETAQSIFTDKDTITSIEIQVASDSVFSADTIGDKIIASLNNKDLSVTNWKDQNAQLLSGLQGQSISSYMIQVFVLISVVLGIASVLAITVMQKSKQIGILKAMGMKNKTTSYVFLFEGLILGFFGGIMGILLGLGLSVAFTKFALNPDGTPVIALYLNSTFILASGLIAVVSSVAASLIPAVKSSKLNPIDIIRNN